MNLLRGPEGCPWDRAQTYDSLKSLLLEEAYEVIDAANSRDFGALEEELGDLLFQVIFYARLAEEENRFNIDDLVQRLHAKLVRRHPHVFGPKRARTPEEALESWNAVKAQERNAQQQGGEDSRSGASLLDGISPDLPAALEAHELGMRASEAGFDWPAVEGLLEKVEEEIGELRDEIQGGTQHSDPDCRNTGDLNEHFTHRRRVEEEVGDLLFAVANLARWVGSDAESCLRRANRKFTRRFRALEGEIASRGKQVHDCSMQELDEVWNTVKDL